VLCENTVGAPGLLAEHGLCFYIETKSGCYLFDTGQGKTLVYNAKSLKKDLSKINKIFLSHSHYDHTGGLKQVLRYCRYVEIYSHPEIFLKRFAKEKTRKRDLGVPFSKKELENNGAIFRFSKDFREVEKGIYLTGEIPRINSFERSDPRLLIKKDGKLLKDPILDDQSLIIDSKKGLIVLLGCAHAGLINTLSYIRDLFKERPIYYILGGTHLGFLKENQLLLTIDHLKKLDFYKIGLSHCTGLYAAARLYASLGERVFFANTGTTIRI